MSNETGTRMDLRSCKNPIAGRIFAIFLGIATWSTYAGANPLTEAEVIRLVGTRDPTVDLARDAVSVARVEEVRASLYPNPSVGWDREHVPAGGERVDDFSLTLPIEVDGRRGSSTALARAGVARAEAAVARTRSEATTLALHLFYDALASAKDVELAARVAGRLEEAARIVGSRRAVGTVSGYELTRLEVEAELARSVLRQAEARARVIRTVLALRLGVEPAALELSGDLTIAPVPRAPTQPAPARPSLDLLQKAEEETRAARAAARWTWLPTLSVSGGLRIDGTSETRYGYLAGLTASLPIFSNGQDLRAEASARQRLAAAEVRVAERSARLETARAQQELRAAREELGRFEEATRERVDRLERAAASGYREGERSIVELVDAQRARTEVERRRLDLQVAAKRAEVELRAAQGEFE